MAQKGQILSFVCRACRHQLKRSWSNSRSFASTPQRAKVIPSFTPTSNTELDEIFLIYRQKVFTPFALAEHHRDLIYKKSRHQILLNDPGVTVTLSNDEEVRLMPMERYDKPNKQKSLRRLTQLLGDSNDARRWVNLPGFLEGMKMAHENLPKGWLEKITRKANEQEKSGVIKLCAQMVKKTGASLSDPGMTRELILGYHIRAAEANFEKEVLEQALKDTEQLALMMEDELHCAGKLKEGQEDMRRNLLVIGVLLELFAAKAINVDGGKDNQGKVSGYASKLVAIGQNELFEVKYEHGEVQRQLESRIPLWNGIRMALNVDGIAQGANGKHLRNMQDRLEQAIRQAEVEVKKEAEAASKPRRCLIMLAKLDR